MWGGKSTRFYTHLFGTDSAENIAQSVNSGVRLESFATTCVCAASHANGIKGITFADFLSELCFHIFDVKEDCSRHFNVKNNGIFSDCSTLDQKLLVPFYSPPNAKWPESLLKIDGSLFGQLERTINSERIDIKGEALPAPRVLDLLVIESKDYSKNLKSNDVIEIVKRVKSGCKIHFVFTRSLQLTYFDQNKSKKRDANNKKEPNSYAKEFNNTEALKYVFVKVAIDTASKQLIFSDIKGLPSCNTNKSPPSCVVFFFECPVVTRIVATPGGRTHPAPGKMDRARATPPGARAPGRSFSQ